jgi:hypothetical protein
MDCEGLVTTGSTATRIPLERRRGESLMPHLQTKDQLDIGFTGSTPATRHASLSGARAAIRSASGQAARILVLYLSRGASTDGEIAQILST